MKKHILLIALLAMTSGVAAAADFKVGFVNTDRVFRDSAPAKRAQAKLEKEFASREQELQRLAKQARDLQQKLEKDGMTMSEADRRAKERELADLNQRLQRNQREFREDLNQRRNEELSAVMERANKAIVSIAEAEKFDLILQEAVYASPRIDVTDKVLKALEK